MKALSFLLVLVFSSTCCGASAAPKNVNFKGSPNDIEKEINGYFPIGMDRTEVIDALTSKFGVRLQVINVTKIDKEPIEKERDGKKHLIYSWVNATLAEYRSMAALFAKASVTAQFDFDSNDKLLFYRVWVARGPEL
jgi:hypothetical protein